ncbi:MAG: YceI family protein [Oligoflexia bacterium]|nr:YceI family protein [Oligoflexia bacterium]
MKILLTIALLTLCVNANANIYKIDPAHSSVEFKVRHFFGKVSGRFNEFTGEFVFDEKKPEKSSGKMTIKAKSVDTANDDRDKHLRNEDFFDSSKFDEITFESKSFKKVGKDKYRLTGPMTIRGVTKDVTFTVEHLGTIEKDPWGMRRASFIATTKINRKDFGIVYNKSLDASAIGKAKKLADKTVIGDTVEISVTIEATPKG